MLFVFFILWNVIVTRTRSQVANPWIVVDKYPGNGTTLRNRKLAFVINYLMDIGGLAASPEAEYCSHPFRGERALSTLERFARKSGFASVNDSRTTAVTCCMADQIHQELFTETVLYRPPQRLRGCHSDQLPAVHVQPKRLIIPATSMIGERHSASLTLFRFTSTGISNPIRYGTGPV